MPATAQSKIRHSANTGKRRSLTGPEKMRAHRARMRAKGMRLVQFWIPDTTHPAFIARVRRDIEMVRGTKSERDAMAFIRAGLEDAGQWT
jgi:hypothetical protein